MGRAGEPFNRPDQTEISRRRYPCADMQVVAFVPVILRGASGNPCLSAIRRREPTKAIPDGVYPFILRKPKDVTVIPFTDFTSRPCDRDGGGDG